MVRKKLTLELVRELDTLREIQKFLVLECHRWEQEKKGSYETRRSICLDKDGDFVVKGSGMANSLAKKLYNIIKEKLND